MEKEKNVFDTDEFREMYAGFTADSMNGTFKRGFREGAPRRVPMAGRDSEAARKWLDRVCEIHKELYGIEIEYYFDGLIYFKEK